MELTSAFVPAKPIARTIWKGPLGVTGLVARDGKLAAIHTVTDPAQFAHKVELTYGTPGKLTRTPFLGIIRQLEEYFAGSRLVFKIPLDLSLGTPFQRQVWRGLLDIPYGETVTYKQLAKDIGRPSALRAVGAANGANPIPIIVPCHRVVAAGGKLGGFSAGLYLKRRLLDLETQTRLRVSSFGMLDDSWVPRARPR